MIRQKVEANMFTRFSAGSYPGKSKRIYTIVFLIFVVITMICIFVGMKQTSHRQQDIDEGRQQISIERSNGKIVLTDELLRSDYTVYAKDAETGANIFLFLAIGMGGFVAFFIVSMIISVIRSIRNGETGTRLIISVISLVLTLVILGIGAFMIGSGIFSTSSMKATDPDKATFSIFECQITSKDSKTVKSGSRKHRTSHTYYYLYLSDGTQLTVDSFVYNQVTTAGTYYLAKNDQGKIFSMYSSSEYIAPSYIEEDAA